MKGKLLVTACSVLVLSTYLVAHDKLDFEGTYTAPALSAVGGGSVLFDASGVALTDWLTLADLDPLATSGNDCWGYTAPSGREYAIIGTETSTCFVEITDPGEATLIATMTGPTSLWRDIKTYQTYAYSVTEGGGGIQVFDLSTIDSGTVTLVNTVATGGCTQASHNVAIDTTSGFLYRCGGSGSPCGGGPQGLVIYDLATPSAPSFVGSWNTKYVHDAQVVTWDLAGPHFGKQIAFCAANNTSGGGSPSLFILDVTNKASISVIGSTTYASSAFSHQVWLSADKQYAYLNDELDESSFGGNTSTRILDVSDLTAPFMTGTFSSGTTSIDHNLYVDGDVIYEANYRSGLRVFDATNPTAPVQTAYFDTYEADDDAAFNSLWSCYPFFPSGTVIGSDLEKGLFVWHIGDPELCFAYPNGKPALVDPAGSTSLLVEVEEDSPGDLDETTVTFHVDTGSGFQAVPMTQLGGSLQFEAFFPSSTCGDTVRYFVSAKSVNGITWSDPPAGETQVGIATSAVYAATLHFDDVESDLGWTVGEVGDSATTGIWTRVDPLGTAAQPEDDHTDDPADTCWVTGQGTGGSVGENDVDGGVTTLISYALDASGLTDPSVSYWRWFSNNVGVVDDTFTVDISNGGPWVNLETVGPTGVGTMGGWIKHTARISDFVAPNANVRLRFQARDLGSGSIVEAAIDDLSVEDFVCTVAIAAVSPDSGHPRGTNLVTITGQGFVDGVTTVSFGGQASPAVNVLDATTLVAEVPPLPRAPRKGRVTQAVDVSVSTGPGSDTLAGGYTYEVELQSAP